MSKKDAKSHAEIAHFHFQYVGFGDAIGVCVHNALD